MRNNCHTTLFAVTCLCSLLCTSCNFSEEQDFQTIVDRSPWGVFLLPDSGSDVIILYSAPSDITSLTMEALWVNGEQILFTPVKLPKSGDDSYDMLWQMPRTAVEYEIGVDQPWEIEFILVDSNGLKLVSKANGLVKIIN